MLYKEIEEIIGEGLDESIREEEIEGIFDNTREATRNCLLVLLDSVSGSYELNVKEIEKISPRLIICDEKIRAELTIPHISVRSAREVLSRLYSLYYKIDYSTVDFIAVTGTNGKTTTATMIYEILLYAGYKAGFIGTGKIEYMRERYTDIFYSMTTPDPRILYSSIARMQKSGVNVIVMEVSSHALALKKVAPIPFRFALFTNLSAEHLDFHKSTEEYYRAKLSLFSQAENGIFNSDDKYSARAMSECFDICNTTSIGIIYEGEAKGRDIIIHGFDGASFLYKDEKRIFKVSLSLIGYHNIYNALFALRCAIDYGVKPYIAREAISKIKSIDGRFEIIRDDLYVIIDYAHTPEAFENVLKFVNTSKKPWQNIITVFGCGGDRDKTKRPVMARIACKYSDSVIITEDNSRTESYDDIINDIMAGAADFDNKKVIFSRKEAIEYAITTAEDNDIVLILGKGHERYNIGKDGYTRFNEKEIIKEALRVRRKGK